jgi:hypothetical protein
LIIDLAGLRLFNEIWEVPPYDDHYRKSDGYISPELAKNNLFKRMTDCEIVLRFFAFRRPKAIKGSSRAILNRESLGSDQCRTDWTSEFALFATGLTGWTALPVNPGR